MAVNDLTNLIIYHAECYACGCKWTQIDTIDQFTQLPCIKCRSMNVVPKEFIKASNQKRIIPNYKTDTK